MIPFYTTVDEAEDAFYEAIARANLDALMAAWSDDEDIVCIHPTGHRMDGQRAIRESWRAIFDNNPRFFVRIHARARWESSLISAHCVVETLHVPQEQVPRGLMRSTNVFIRGTRGWRLVSRHTSAALEQAGAGDEDAFGSQKHTLH
jgi:ketosteroid isomerase-like protein